MATQVLEPGEARTALLLESVLSTAAVVWWTYLLWTHRDALYDDSAPVVLILAVVLSLLVTWALWLRTGRLRGVILTSAAVRGVVALTLSLWFFQDL
ncbi:hypothetical protein R6V09_27830 [Streptomyces sp. W16]|uniref:hypothetical protein n=1 Tax=Streptomyces sp. W16 TaxID=3076631 RepID=UPI00295ADAD2|nr:hypothetical protein [Streptomyces sp. W16]MDV9173904.1 hypothetical protein [Streptomyces sp. W16]